MRISSIKSFFNKYIPLNRQNVTSAVTHPAPQNQSATDVFKKRSYLRVLDGIRNDDEKINFALRFLYQNPMNEKVYAELSPSEFDSLRAQLSPNYIKTATTLVNASKMIKKIFDVKYGENQYTFVSVGRSLSALANCLEFMGVETRQIPLSNCGGLFLDISKNVNTMVGQVGFKDYKKFLEKTFKPQGDKKYIVCDFLYTGNSFSVFKDFLNHKKVNLGSKIEGYVGINKNFFLYNLDCNSKELKRAIGNFQRMLVFQKFDDYAEVRSLDFKELDKINSDIDSPLKPQYPLMNRLMKFCMLDILHTTT